MGSVRPRLAGELPADPCRITCATCEAREHSPWSGLDSEELELLRRVRSIQPYRSGQVIFREGSPCFGIHCIRSGTVVVRRIDLRGVLRITEICQAGHLLGDRAYFTGGDHKGTAKAITECQVCFFQRDTVLEMLLRNAKVGDLLLERFARNLNDMEERMLAHRSLSVEARLAYLFLAFKDRFDDIDDEGNIVMELPFTRAELADLVGARPESLSRAIRQLNEVGVAHCEKRVVTIPDLDALLDVIEGKRSS
jgi:CRP/FNR family transcriptional regulator